MLSFGLPWPHVWHNITTVTSMAERHTAKAKMFIPFLSHLFSFSLYIFFLLGFWYLMLTQQNLTSNRVFLSPNLRWKWTFMCNLDGKCHPFPKVFFQMVSVAKDKSDIPGLSRKLHPKAETNRNIPMHRHLAQAFYILLNSMLPWLELLSQM